jgi:hypothetical protein
VKKKKWISKGLVVMIVLAVAAIAACAAPSPGEQAAPTPTPPLLAPSSIWLKEENTDWVPYEVKEEDGEYKIFLDLPDGSQLYAVSISRWGDVTKFSPQRPWVRFIRYKGDNHYNDEWNGLAPFSTWNHGLDVERVEMYADWGGTGEAAFFYANTDDSEWWVFWSPTREQLNILHQGRLAVTVCRGYSEEELISLAAKGEYP